MLLYDKYNRVVGEIYPEYEADDVERKGKRIALCIGHNVESQGAIGSSGISEYTFNKNFLDELMPYLPPNHEYKIFKRKPLASYSKEQIDLSEQITEWGDCDIAIEFHFNDAENPSASGHEILYLSDNGKQLAEKLDKAYDEHLNNSDRNIKRRASGNGYGFLSRGDYTSIIVEPFFAAHQYRFVGDGDLLQPLIASYKSFFSEL
jgi:N-acetylmuramoyl-L-alanine amidase